MELKELIERIHCINDSLDANNMERKENLLLLKSMKLSEEVGELYNEILGNLGLQRSDKAWSRENLEGEFADVLITTLVLAVAMGVDVETSLDTKLKKVYSRFNLK